MGGERESFGGGGRVGAGTRGEEGSGGARREGRGGGRGGGRGRNGGGGGLEVGRGGGGGEGVGREDETHDSFAICLLFDVGGVGDFVMDMGLGEESLLWKSTTITKWKKEKNTGK